MPTTKNVRSLAKKYWKQAEDDLKNAKTNLKQQKLEAGLLLIQQGALNCLNAICHAGGSFQNPAYNLVELLASCERVHPDFAELHKLCEQIDDVYSYRLFSDHVKGGKQISKDKAQSLLKQGHELFKRAKQLITKNDVFSP